MPHELSAACWVSGENSSFRSTSDFDSLAYTSSKRSIALNAGPVSWQTCNLRIAEAAMPLPPEIRIIFFPSCCVNSTGIRRTSQGFIVKRNAMVRPTLCLPDLSLGEEYSRYGFFAEDARSKDLTTCSPDVLFRNHSPQSFNELDGRATAISPTARPGNS